MGYATVQDDLGTPYWMSGGLGGDTVLATNEAELRQYLNHDDPYIVQVAGKIEGTGRIDIRSHKTLMGITDSAHVVGIELTMTNNHRNIIVRDITISHVPGGDCLRIAGQNPQPVDPQLRLVLGTGGTRRLL